MTSTAMKLTQVDQDAAHDAAQCVVETHRRLADWLRLGVTLPEIDRYVAQTLEDLKCRSCFLGYKVPKVPPFPSHACLSVNECVVHGTAGYYLDPMKEGDVLKIDIGVTHKGWIGDAAWTYVFGEPTDEVRRLTDCGKESIRIGIETLRADRPMIDWARALQEFVEGERDFHLVRGLGGHGYGRRLHEAPFIANTVPTFRGEWPDAYKTFLPGMLLAVEPMIAIGTGAVVQERGGWPMYTADGSLAVHYEHDVLVTSAGPRVLTEGLDEIDDVITR